MFKLFSKKKSKTPAPTLPTCETNQDGIEIRVTRVSHRPFYDSKWSVDVGVVNEDGYNIRKFTTEIVRDESEKPETLEKAIRAFGHTVNYDNIRSLDERAKIFYD